MSNERGELGKTSLIHSSTDVDIQIAGPALTLFFAALGAQGSPPTISSPDGSFTLSSADCPASFQSFFELWQASVKPIQRLSSDSRHDLALLLAGKETVSSPIQVEVVRLASSLKGIGLEITQRRTFQQRYQQDLDAALASHVRPRRSGESERHALYSPPPAYDGPGPSADEEKRQPQALYGASAPSHQPSGADQPLSSFQSSSSPRLLENLYIIRETLYSGKVFILHHKVLADLDTLQPSPTPSSQLLRCSVFSDVDQNGHRAPTLHPPVSLFWRSPLLESIARVFASSTWEATRRGSLALARRLVNRICSICTPRKQADPFFLLSSYSSLPPQVPRQAR